MWSQAIDLLCWGFLQKPWPDIGIFSQSEEFQPLSHPRPFFWEKHVRPQGTRTRSVSPCLSAVLSLRSLFIPKHYRDQANACLVPQKLRPKAFGPRRHSTVNSIPDGVAKYSHLPEMHLKGVRVLAAHLIIQPETDCHCALEWVAKAKPLTVFCVTWCHYLCKAEKRHSGDSLGVGRIQWAIK